MKTKIKHEIVAANATQYRVVHLNGKFMPNHLLAGITRDFIFELAKEQQLPLQECKITAAELHAADEIWITSSTKEIYPIVKLDEQLINNGKPGIIWQKMIRYYHQHLQEYHPKI